MARSGPIVPALLAGSPWTGKALRSIGVICPGKNLRGAGFSHLVVHAKGVSGAPHPAFFQVEGNIVTLSTEWQEFRLDVRGKDFSNVSCDFVFIVRTRENPSGASFRLDQIRYEQVDERD